MNKLFVILLLTVAMCWMTAPVVRAQEKDEDVTVIAPTSEAAEGLDLHAVAEIFKESENLEAFEKALNEPDAGINNLDLNEDNEVDYIRVMEEVGGETHVIALQAALGEDEFQDVATIEVEKEGDENYNMQVRGNEELYGIDYYVAPTVVYVHTWPIIPWIYRPVYYPYHSAFYFGFYPRWWHPYRPVSVSVYRTRTVHYRTRVTFSVTRTPRVRTVTRVNYKPRSSTLATRKVTVRKTTTVGGKKKTTSVGVKQTKTRKGTKTTVTRKKTTKTRSGKKTTTTKKIGVRK